MDRAVVSTAKNCGQGFIEISKWSNTLRLASAYWLFIIIVLIIIKVKKGKERRTREGREGRKAAISSGFIGLGGTTHRSFLLAIHGPCNLILQWENESDIILCICILFLAQLPADIKMFKLSDSALHQDAMTRRFSLPKFSLVSMYSETWSLEWTPKDPGSLYLNLRYDRIVNTQF